MRLGISNIAWDISEDKLIASILKKNSIDAIDIVPGKYFPVPSEAKEAEVKKIRSWWLERGVEITGMQSLLYNTDGLNIFSDEVIQKRMLNHLSAICKIAGILGAKKLAFGSPKNRDRSGLTDAETMNVAIPFFQKLGNIAAENNVIVCLEPNPICYGANFMTTSYETAEVVQEVGHDSIKMLLDVGALSINNENPELIIQKYSSLVGHIHTSEPGLAPIGNSNTNHRKVARALEKFLPTKLVTIEMLATKDENHASSIQRALSHAIVNYRPI